VLTDAERAANGPSVKGGPPSLLLQGPGVAVGSRLCEQAPGPGDDSRLLGGDVVPLGQVLSQVVHRDRSRRRQADRLEGPDPNGLLAAATLVEFPVQVLVLGLGTPAR